MSETTSHHPSCTSSDRQLGWYCYQCGVFEADETGSELAELVLKASNTPRVCHTVLPNWEEWDAIIAKAREFESKLGKKP